MPLEKKNDAEDVDHQDTKGSASSPDESHQLDSSGEGEVFRKKLRMHSPSPGASPRGTPQASPPRVSLEQIIAAANGVTNMTLAHEIAVDKDFVLKQAETQELSLEKHIKDLVHKAFWENLKESLAEDPPNYTHAIGLLGEVKESLFTLLLPAHTKIRTEINEVLDLELIKQQAEHNSLDVHKYAEFVIGIMSQLCAPVRDDEIQKIHEITDVIELFKEIFRVIDLMKLDMANFTIQSIRPTIQQHSIEYERKKFEELLKNQEDYVDGLEFTKKWLKDAAEKIVALQQAFHAAQTASSTVVDGATASTMATAPTMATIPPAVVLNQGYINLLQWDDLQLFPETLLMDQGRFLDIRDKVDKLVLVSSVLLVTYNTVGASIAGIQGFVEKLKNIINILLEGDGEMGDKLVGLSEQICKEVNECLTKHSFPSLEETTEKALKTQIQSLKEEANNIRKLLDVRAKAFFRLMISATTPFDPKTKIPPGLGPVHQELISLSGQFCSLVVHNRSVFISFYSDIITEVKKQTTESKNENEKNVSKEESVESVKTDI
ncbi:T-complex protein 11-like protein 1 [Saccoglossus kowalevskii]|uniref:T-complex protein 11-like protein 1-like n=1 Tax=Saccoglossus kowalevskii TaxID=10224 RepID=A0ABM0GYP4_SACKO|nr:PREDICTED: T-complex protein 11-like protein 1-like [Saccoglossus kowalevskii]